MSSKEIKAYCVALKDESYLSFKNQNYNNSMHFIRKAIDYYLTNQNKIDSFIDKTKEYISFKDFTMNSFDWFNGEVIDNKIISDNLSWIETYQIPYCYSSYGKVEHKEKEYLIQLTQCEGDIIVDLFFNDIIFKSKINQSIQFYNDFNES